MLDEWRHDLHNVRLLSDAHADFRRRGYHGQMIRMRLRDALEMGAQRAFTITDFDSQSSYDLQHHGFTLAYNSLLMTRESVPMKLTGVGVLAP